ncbi:hypothetical protein A9Q81_11310 [Gammaproteobacteria bacterium 42_54_T18]|nr:hypothetical protein A9Q81_11310 [Gammaproteobacteria bacterium 42_54_T18]
MSDKATIIAIAASFLFVLYLLPLPKVSSTHRFSFIIYPTAFFILGLVLVKIAVPDQQKISIEPRISGLYNNIDLQIEKFNTSTQYKNFILISGGSLCNRGIDPEQLQNALKDKQYKSLVTQICLPGANHFERNNILEYAEKTLTTKLSRKANVIFLREAFQYYDNVPLAQLKKHPDQRTIAYMDLYNSINAIITGLSVDINNEKHKTTPSHIIGVIRSSIMNISHIGLVDRFSFNGDIYNGYTPLFEPIEHTPVSKNQVQHALDLTSNTPNEIIKIPNWVFKYTYQPNNKPVYDAVINFITPTLHNAALTYFYAICKSSDVSCLNDPTLAATIKKLEDNKFWYDSGDHLLQEGAKISTSWLATSLISRNVLK